MCVHIYLFNSGLLLHVPPETGGGGDGISDVAQTLHELCCARLTRVSTVESLQKVMISAGLAGFWSCERVWGSVGLKSQSEYHEQHYKRSYDVLL